MAARSPLINVMAAAAQKAGRYLVRDFGEVENLQVSRKGPGDFVSLADTRAEQVIRDALAKARPDYGFVLEEGGVVEGKDPLHRWHVDPLDGTTNFLHGIPHFCTSVALEREGVAHLLELAGVAARHRCPRPQPPPPAGARTRAG